jgi:hypothetical protein
MNNIEQRVHETLDSLDGIRRAEANPYLYTRIEQRIRNRYEPSYPGKLMPVLAMALVLFISLNVLSYLKVDTGSTSVKAPGNGIESFATEYYLVEEGGL